MGQVGSRAIALGPIGQHELHSELICYSHTGPYSQPHKTHGVHTASPPQGTRGAYSHPHKTHGVHTARPTRHTGCIQPPPQVRTAILTRRIYIFSCSFWRKPCNTSSLQQIRPEDLFCYYAICAMAWGASLKLLALTLYSRMTTWLSDALPDAKLWQPFSQDAGDMAFQDKPQLFTSHFNLNGTWYAYKYNFWLSMNANGQEVKVYQHCRGLHTIFVRRAPSLRVYLSTSQIGVGETTHMISLKKEDDVVIFEKEFGNDGSDITLGQILPVAWRHLIENDHVTYAGKLEVIFEGLLIFEGYGRFVDKAQYRSREEV